MTRILVTYATRMGSTGEIAGVIGAELTAAGYAVDVVSCEENPAPSTYDAVVMGSAVYVGHWDRRAVRYLHEHTAVLTALPVWLFQSGPCGEGATHEEISVPRGVRRVVSAIGASPVVTFGGRLDVDHATGRLSRWMATGVLAGDFRDFESVRNWARQIDLEMTARPPAAALSPYLLPTDSGPVV